MECKYEVEHIWKSNLSFEEIKYIICEKIARLIISDEKKNEISHRGVATKLLMEYLDEYLK